MKLLFLIVFVLLSQIPMFSQSGFFSTNDTAEIDCSSLSVDFGLHNRGISLGNSPSWKGLRVNFSDCGINEITGINITLWKSGRNPGSIVKGISMGLAPSAGTLQGLSLGLMAVSAKQELSGINIGGLAVESEGDIWGINLGGLATVAGKNLMGLNFGGLATVSEGEITGLNFNGLATVAESEITGLNSALFASVSKKGITGLNFTGFMVDTPKINGMNVSLGWTDVHDLNGLSISGFNQIRGSQSGLVIGLLNIAGELNGVQIGLLNIAWNNSGLAKILPFVNWHFD